jgi:hypothetical protein
MANYAKIGLNNTVIGLLLVDNYDCMDDDGIEREELGVQFLQRLTGHETWVKFSFNTRGGKHYAPNSDEEDSKPPFRKNPAVIGGTYDAVKDAFIPPKPEQFPSWVLNEETCLWEAPVAKPDGYGQNQLAWDEENQNWIIKVRDGVMPVGGGPRYVLPE